jgi:CheY-like chemotaxis protein
MMANKIIFSHDKPDLIIIDVMMPMLDGTEKAKLLKGWDFTKGIPVLLISSKTQDELQQLVETSRADGYIQKPFNASAIIGAVSKVLRT